MVIQSSEAFSLQSCLCSALVSPITVVNVCWANADHYMHFSCVFAVSSVKVTCRAGSLGHTGTSFSGPPGAVSCKSLGESSLCGPSTSGGPGNVSVCTAGALEPACGPAWNDPGLPVLPSGGYRKVCEVLTISRSSCEHRDGESREMMEEERWPLVQWNCRPSLRPRPPILQNRHLIFSISLRTTVFLSRM